MKYFKSVTAVFLAAVIALSFAACKAKPDNNENPSDEPSTVVVTDKNGEAVTDKDGNPVTEKAEGNKKKANVSEKESSIAEESTKKKDKEEEQTTEKETTTQPVSKVKNPNTPTDFKASKITETSLTLSWKSVTCDYYELEYMHLPDGDWEVIDDKLDATQIEISGLTSFTKYAFRLRAIIKHKAGNSESAWVETTAKTKEQDITREIEISIQLPARNNEEDKLVLYIEEDGKKREKILSKKVTFDGSVIKFKTKEKYKGTVTLTAKLVNVDTVKKIKTDKDKCFIDISQIGMDILIGDDD
ncbi:MAG: fibronectin type III domain-containing protein [Eubacterium sp.]|nr:fibronectin type III domain-containing protein [Eubacterium sp.]